VLPDGTTDDSSPGTLRPLLAPAQVRAVLADGRRHRTTAVAGLRGDWRLLEVPTTVDGRQAVLVIGRSIAARAETLDRLEREFVLVAPAALLLAILAGYVLAAAALRPVEAMRRRASAISATTPGRRLPVASTRDEISALAVTLNEMLGRLEEALEHERRFVADASHELRTPLALLRAELELALRRPRSHDELETAIRSAKEETERLSRLAEDLLLIARSDQGTIPLRVEEVRPTQLLDNVRQRFHAHAESLGRDVRVENGRVAPFEADSLRLEQALGNLVDNALAHGAGDVTLQIIEIGDTVELHVRDEGAGFPDWFAGRAFDRFSRAEESRNASGTGLGLAIVAAIAAAHGGGAHAATTDEGGADVWLALPTQRSSPTERDREPLGTFD
jgi:signal transduction histidine kinase